MPPCSTNSSTISFDPAHNYTPTSVQSIRAIFGHSNLQRIYIALITLETPPLISRHLFEPQKSGTMECPEIPASDKENAFQICIWPSENPQMILRSKNKESDAFCVCPTPRSSRRLKDWPTFRARGSDNHPRCRTSWMAMQSALRTVSFEKHPGAAGLFGKKARKGVFSSSVSSCHHLSFLVAGWSNAKCLRLMGRWTAQGSARLFLLQMRQAHQKFQPCPK